MFNWLHRLLGGKRTPQDTQWPQSVARYCDAVEAKNLETFYALKNNPPVTVPKALFPRMVQAVNEDRLKATLKPQPDAWRKNFTKTPEQRKADHAKSVATKALKKARTAELRAALQRSVEEA